MHATRIFDILENYKSKYPNKKDALSAKVNGKWHNYSVNDYIETANYVSYGLLSMGFEPGDKIATVSNNRPEWNFMDMGMLQIGVVHVPIYPTISETEYEHILKHSEAKIIIVSSTELYEKIKPVVDKIGKLPIYSFDAIEGISHWTEIVEKGKSSEGPEMRGKVKLIKDTVKKEDLATIIYTSGTTGLPKGVMLSHWNFMYQVHRIDSFLNVNSNHKALSFLPLCHVLERIGGYVWQYRGLGIYYAESIEKISENIKEVKPQAFITVPRLLERIYDKIIGIGKDLEGTKKNLFFWAVDLGLNYKDHGNSLAYLAKLKIANMLIFKKWREALGGNVRLIIAGGAALQPRLARIFWAAGIPVHEGYGLTETAPVIAVNRFKYPDLMFGTVGPKLGDEQEIKIAEDGEILFKGPNLMLGYYKDEEKTKEAIDSDGWFHTGDIGEMVGNNLKITDRKKEIFKLSTGK
jgi:long-chain acyl-CoA synthetase